MRAITISEPGGPEVLTWSEAPEPTPGPGEVLIEVVATAVNRADIMQRQGHYPPPSGASPVPGLECSGRIAAVGEDVAEWSVGDEVCALLSGGGYAERVAVPAGQVLPVPGGVSLAEAAALPEVACTVWSNVFTEARLMPGEVFLVHGGGSGIGTMAIQLARSYGARVFATARSAKHAACIGLGAERVIDYRDEDFVAVVGEATGGHGADVVLDNMGASYLARNLQVLAVGGRLAVIGLQGGRTAELDLGMLLAKRARVGASGLRSRSSAEKAVVVAAVRDHVWPLIEAARIRPVVDRALAMPDAAQAHRIVEAGEHIGKVLLVR
ncbi:MAG: NAD(P)H-quinone oxidoreductase [Pseudonocardia sp.]|nr:NAD(P)H-quinone oxidoreductase [Pseudonocardia sp.]